MFFSQTHLSPHDQLVALRIQLNHAREVWRQASARVSATLLPSELSQRYQESRVAGAEVDRLEREIAKVEQIIRQMQQAAAVQNAGVGMSGLIDRRFSTGVEYADTLKMTGAFEQATAALSFGDNAVDVLIQGMEAHAAEYAPESQHHSSASSSYPTNSNGYAIGMGGSQSNSPELRREPTVTSNRKKQDTTVTPQQRPQFQPIIGKYSEIIYSDGSSQSWYTPPTDSHNTAVRNEISSLEKQIRDLKSRISSLENTLAEGNRTFKVPTSNDSLGTIWRAVGDSNRLSRIECIDLPQARSDLKRAQDKLAKLK